MGRYMSDSIQPIIHVGNVNCKLEGAPASILGRLSQELSVKVPNYWFSSKYKAGMWDGTQRFFRRPANTFATGLLPRVIDLVEELTDVTPQVIDDRQDIGKYALSPITEGYMIADGKEARDYQVDAVNSIISHQVGGIPFQRGIINIATNGGKTSIASMYISELYPKLVENGTVFLFVTHSKEIARQTKAVLEENLGIDIGFIGDGKWDVRPVSIAIISTMYRRRNKPELRELCKQVIGFVGDEVHHSSSTSWFDTFQMFTQAQIRIGLTGTVDKSNPVNEMRLYCCTSEVIAKVTNEQLIDGGYSARPVCIFMQVDSPNLDDMSYEDAYSLGVVESEERLVYITEICRKEVSAGNTVLILVERIEHGNIIAEELGDVSSHVYFTNGTLDSETRQGLLDATRDNKVDVLIATSILDEGVDVSNINAIIYARGMKSQRKLLQGIGRGLRRKADGSNLRFYDFIDNMSPQLLKHSENRYLTLKGEGFNIKLLDIDTYKAMDWESINE